MRTPWIALLLLLVSRSHADERAGRALEITVDATSGADLGLRVVSTGLEVGKPYWVKQIAPTEQIAFTPPVFTTPEGEVLEWEKQNQRFVVASAPSSTVIVEYRATPGGRARHGHQGLVTEEWAGFDGRVVLQPREIADYRDVRWHFELPEGWVVASSLVPVDADTWAMPEMDPRFRASVLKSLCMGLGPFAEDRRTLGGSEFRVFTMGRWEDREELSNKAHGVIRYFHEELGFAPKGPFAVVWTPAGPGMAPVWSGSGATATCYERPQGGFHNWELLGHRLAHPINEYAPLGLAYPVWRDHWFMEGWATYIERPALTAAGVADMGRLNALLRNHHEELDANPELAAFRLADEPNAPEAMTENIHYRRGPLVATMLADQVQRRSGKTLEQFMRRVFETHGGFQRGLDLRAELAAFTGAPLDDFWEAMVDQPGPVIPVWEAYLKELPAVRPGPALRAGGVEWSGDQLFGMLHSGEFAGAVELAELLRQTGQKHDELARRNVHLLPPTLDEVRTAWPLRTRMDLDALERRWPLEGGPPLQSGGCWGSPGPLALPTLLALDDDGRAFLALVEAERTARMTPGGDEGLVSIRFGHDDFEPRIPGSSAAITTTERLRVRMLWDAPRIGMRLEVWKGADRLVKRWVETQSDWTSTWMRIGTDDLGDATGLLDVRLVSGGRVVGNRPVWRRASAAPGELPRQE